MANLIGQQRGNFKLTQLLGQGGFAEVYLGEHIHFQGDKVAIKVLYTHLDEKGIEQFKKEALVLRKLSHPHIIKVLDFGFDNNIPYLIMEYAPNDSLAKRHPIGKPLPIVTVIDYIRQIADALQYAHDNKFIHRDVKPANMLIGANGSILLSDFGIARVAHTYTLGTKNIVGSPEYMSPEQGNAEAGAVFASDQYSLGIVVYQWLCGNLPFQGEDGIQLMYKHRYETPPPFPESLRIPTNVENVLKKALAKDPQQRFASVQEFANALEQANKGVAFPTQAPPLIKARQGGKLPIKTQSMQPQSSSNIDLGMLYHQGAEAYATGEAYSGQYRQAIDSLEKAEQFWQQILAVDPNYMNGTLSTHFTELQQKLSSIRVQELREQARDHYRAGRWHETIQSWETLLKLKPEDAEAQKSIGIAQHNMQHAPRYASARRFVQEKNFTFAKKQLADLKNYAPEYGDPENLASTIQREEAEADRPRREAEAKKKTDATLIRTILSALLLPLCVGGIVGLLTQSIILTTSIAGVIATILGIFFTIVLLKPHTASNSILIASFIIGAIVAIGLAVFIVWRTIETQQIWGLVAVSVVSSVIMLLLITIILYGKMWFNILLFLSATGIASGLVAENWLSQSWIVATGIVIILALVTYWLGYRKATGPLSMITTTLLSIAVVFAATWYTSKLNYNYFEVSSFWFAHRHLWIGRQVNLGLIISIIPGIVSFFLLSLEGSLGYTELDSLNTFLFFLAIGIGFAAILYLLFGGLELFLGWSLGGWGCGFGFGWYFTWLPVLPTLLAELGIFHLLEKISRYY